MPRPQSSFLDEETSLKRCCRCRKHLPFERFNKRGRAKDGLHECCRECQKKHSKPRSEKGKPRCKQWIRARNLRINFGITPEEFDAILNLQGGCCMICRTTEPKGKGKGWCVDHCHKTGRVRGVLCAPCNFLIGLAQENERILMAAILYLESAKSDATPAAFILAQKSDSENSPTEEYPAELESWLIGADTL